MRSFSFKYYPPRILITVICIIVALNFILKYLYETQTEGFSPNLKDLVIWILGGSAISVSILAGINQKIMWPPVLKILNITNINGKYNGHIESSYHIDDDQEQPHIKVYCQLKISQNLNGFKVDGSFYTDDGFLNKSSSFESFNEQLEKLDNGNFRISYLYNNKGNLQHSNHQKYGLSTHLGVCVLTFNTDDRSMEGYYFNHERASSGIIKLEPLSKK